MRYEKEKHKDEVAKYRENLDMMLEGKDRYQSDKGVSLAAMRPEFHNVLTNPLPYNIQNPYILKEMTGLRNPSSYLAMKGSQNLKLGWYDEFYKWKYLCIMGIVHLVMYLHFATKIFGDLLWRVMIMFIVRLEL